MDRYDYDILVIGGGPAGYIAASYATQFGRKTALVEKSKMGGCCVNTGCIPTKIFAEAANRYTKATESESFGIVSSEVSFSMEKLKHFSEKTRNELSDSVCSLLRRRKVDIIEGEAKIIDSCSIVVGKRIITAATIILATGSTTGKPKDFDNMQRVLTSDNFWNLNHLPKSILIVGGGVIGCEIASALNRLGTKVYLVEQMSGLMVQFSRESVTILTKQFQMDGINVMCDSTVSDLKENADGITATIGKESISCEYILWTTGRKPNGIELGDLKIKKTEYGFLETDENFKTSIDSIYTIGDANGKVMLAHAAMYQAMRVVDYICCGQKKLFLPCVPQCVYTSPSIAKIGRSKEECKKLDLPVVTGKISYGAIGYSRATGDARGYIEVIRNINTDTLEGAEIVGKNAYELIHVLVPYVNKKIPVRAMQDLVFAHPTLSEGIKTAVESTYTKSPQL